jgi:nucleotide-binding universal stress UspA family protein
MPRGSRLWRRFDRTVIERVLLAIDGSEPSARAIPYAAALVPTPAGHVRVVTVVERGRQDTPTYDVESDGEACAILDHALVQLKAAGADASGEVRHAFIGGVANEIIRAAHEDEADVIVMGTRGLTEFSALVVGSVTHNVLHAADLPVLLVR